MFLNYNKLWDGLFIYESLVLVGIVKNKKIVFKIYIRRPDLNEILRGSRPISLLLKIKF